MEEAEAAVVRGRVGCTLFGSDLDLRAVDMTFAHLRAAGLDEMAQLSVADVHEVLGAAACFTSRTVSC